MLGIGIVSGFTKDVHFLQATRRLKSFPWDALVYGSIMAFYLNLEKLGKPFDKVPMFQSKMKV